MIAIIAALPREIGALVKGWEQLPSSKNVFVYTKGNAVVGCAGMGAARATLAVQAVMAARPVTSLLSVGVAGACNPALHVGDIVRAGLVVDSRTGEKFEDSRFRQVLVTGAEIASVAEKSRLHASYAADAVDMEAAAVARMARAHGLSFTAIKAISDEADFELQQLGRFATSDGQFREAAFAGYVALRPRLWGKLIGLAGNSKQAIAALTSALETQIEEYGQRS